MWVYREPCPGGFIYSVHRTDVNCELTWGGTCYILNRGWHADRPFVSEDDDAILRRHGFCIISPPDADATLAKSSVAVRCYVGVSRFSHGSIVVMSIHYDLFDVIDPRHQLVRYSQSPADHGCLFL